MNRELTRRPLERVLGAGGAKRSRSPAKAGTGHRHTRRASTGAAERLPTSSPVADPGHRSTRGSPRMALAIRHVWHAHQLGRDATSEVKPLVLDGLVLLPELAVRGLDREVLLQRDARVVDLVIEIVQLAVVLRTVDRLTVLLRLSTSRVLLGEAHQERAVADVRHQPMIAHRDLFELGLDGTVERSPSQDVGGPLVSKLPGPEPGIELRMVRGAEVVHHARPLALGSEQKLGNDDRLAADGRDHLHA